jgi:hypothetical protein
MSKTVARFVAFRGQIYELSRSIFGITAGKFYRGVGIPQFIREWWLAFCGTFESGRPQV